MEGLDRHAHLYARGHSHKAGGQERGDARQQAAASALLPALQFTALSQDSGLRGMAHALGFRAWSLVGFRVWSLGFGVGGWDLWEYSGTRLGHPRVLSHSWHRY